MKNAYWHYFSLFSSSLLCWSINLAIQWSKFSQFSRDQPNSHWFCGHPHSTEVHWHLSKGHSGTLFWIRDIYLTLTMGFEVYLPVDVGDDICFNDSAEKTCIQLYPSKPGNSMHGWISLLTFVFWQPMPRIPKQWLSLIGWSHCSVNNFRPSSFYFQIEICWAGRCWPPTDWIWPV